MASVEPRDHLAFRLGLRGNGVVLHSTTCGAEALSFGIETADMDDAVAVVAPRGKVHLISSAMLGVQNILFCWLVQPGPRKPILHHAQVMLVFLCLRSCRLPCLPVASALARARSGDAGSRCWWSLLGIDLFEGYRVAGSVGYSGYGLAVVPSIAEVTEPSGARRRTR